MLGRGPRLRKLARLVGFGAAFGSVLFAAPLGRLRVQSNPEVEVVWESVSLGTTNERGVMVIDDIPLGSYTVTLSKKGFESRTVSVLITRGETTLRLDLAPEQPQQSVAQPSPGPESRSRSERAAEARSSARRPPGAATPPPTPEPSVIEAPPREAAKPLTPKVVDERPRSSGADPDLTPDEKTPRKASEQSAASGDESPQDAAPPGADPPVPDGSSLDSGESPEPSDARGLSGFRVLGIAGLVLAAAAGAFWWRHALTKSGTPTSATTVERLENSDDDAVRTITAVHRPSFLRELRERESELEKTIDSSAARGPE